MILNVLEGFSLISLELFASVGLTLDLVSFEAETVKYRG